MQLRDPASSPTLEVSDPSRLPPDPVVSVVMLAYRHESTLKDAIEGVLSQRTDHAFELLIGEDCSPDRTREIALHYQRMHPESIRVLYSEENVGTHANSSRVIRASRGRFIAFCEGDDYWTDAGKLQKQIDVMLADKTVSLVHTEFDRLAGGRVLSNFRKTMGGPIASGEQAFGVLLRGNSVVTATAMYRASILRALSESGIAKREWPFGDYPKALYAALHGKVVYLPTSTAVYRHFPGSATAQGRASKMKMYQAAHECREAFLAISSLPEDEKIDVLVNSRKSLLSMSVLSGQLEMYREHMRWLAAHGHHLGQTSNLLSLLLIKMAPLRRLVRSIRKIKRDFQRNRTFSRAQR